MRLTCAFWLGLSAANVFASIAGYGGFVPFESAGASRFVESDAGLVDCLAADACELSEESDWFAVAV